MDIEKIDHICIAVKDLQEARKRFDRLGLKLARSYMQRLGGKPEEDFYIDEREQLKSIAYQVGDCVVEIMESTSPEGEVAKFIAKRGEGVHLLSLRVRDVPAALQALKAQGVQLIDQEPRPHPEAAYAFVHPSSFSGVLIELIQWR